LNFKELVSRKSNIRELVFFRQVLHTLVEKRAKSIVPMSVTEGSGEKEQINSIPELVFFKTGAPGQKKLKFMKL
jgi:delta-aminolevulinic acid dehydratase/porphobilinogen synthase